MRSISDTILGDAEKLAGLHDMLCFKSEVNRESDSGIANSLAECAAYASKASELIVADVVRELSKRNFPATSRLRASPALAENPADVVAEALRVFSSSKAAEVDFMLEEVPQRLENIRNNILRYLGNKDDDLAGMMEQQQYLLAYLMSIAWLDA